VAVIVADTFGRPWRGGTTNVAIGIAGISPLKDYRGQPDLHGRVMQVSISAIADELAGATELVMDKTAAVPAALVRGLSYEVGPASIGDLLRDSSTDMFR
jgi:coenzyme F420-0:L-glutamate ligase/coenzyme F420-1:gamma-L-glutamate ligase